MFKFITISTTLLIVGFNSLAIAGDDDLFTEFSSGTVFADSADSDTGYTAIRPARGKRITSAEDLREMLKAGGFEAKVAGSRVVTAQKKLDPWTFPVLGIVSEDESKITIILGLATIKDAAKELTAEKLLKLMEASQENAPRTFTYNAGRTRTEITRTLENLNLTGERLRDEINRMAIIARDNSEIWISAEQKSAITPKKTETQPTTTSPINLTGKWAAAKSEKEAFGVEFKADGTFNLVYINNGQQTKSSGKFTVANGSLTLNGSDGLKLEGKLTVKSATEFEFKAANATALVFKKAS